MAAGIDRIAPCECWLPTWNGPLKIASCSLSSACKYSWMFLNLNLCVFWLWWGEMKNGRAGATFTSFLWWWFLDGPVSHESMDCAGTIILVPPRPGI
jgi:hypothetical protein